MTTDPSSTDLPPTERRRLTVEEQLLANIFDLMVETRDLFFKVYRAVKIIGFVVFTIFIIVVGLVFLVNHFDNQVQERDRQIIVITDAVDDIQRIAQRFESIIDNYLLNDNGVQGG